MTEPSQYFKGRTVQEQMDEVIGYVDTRAAEVATTAIASDVAQVHQDMLDADADATAAAASAAAAAGTLANAVKKTGESSQTVQGDLVVVGSVSGGRVIVPTPTNNSDAATKKYVDDADALKADKTYVDAQDATKISITDINNYALGLTGNQIADGNKTFRNNYGFITIKSTAYDNETIPASTNTYGSLTHNDTNDKRIYSVLYGRRADGSKLLNITLSKMFSGVEKTATLQLNLFDDGHATLTLTDANGTVKTIANTNQ